MDVTLIVETLDPSNGGIPRYNYEISKIKEFKSIINFSEKLKNRTATDRVLNRLYRRRKYLEENSSNLGEVLHFTQPEVMPKTNVLDGKKIVLTVHDLAVFGTMRIKGAYGTIRGAAFRSQFRYAVERADAILTNSSQTRDELVSILDINSKKITVTNFGIDEKFKPRKDKGDGEDIGYFGGFNRRKRVGKLIDDFIASAISNKVHLVIYGDNIGDYPSLKKRYEKFGSIIFKEKIAEDKLVETINKFKYFVYPTSYEGFGLPLVEAIACGVPAFVYKDSVIPEEVRKYAMEIDRIDDIDSMDYKELKKEYLEKSEKIKKEFTWDGNREAVKGIYKSLINENVK